MGFSSRALVPCSACHNEVVNAEARLENQESPIEEVLKNLLKGFRHYGGAYPMRRAALKQFC